MNNNKLLLISLVFYPDEVAVANLFTSLSTVLVSQGYDMEVWCAQPSYTSTAKQPKTLIYKGIRINYLKSTSFRKDNFAGRIVNVFTFSFIVALRLLFSASRTQVISHTTPPFLAIIISLICKIKKRPFVYVLMDVFPDGLIRLKKVSHRNVFIKIWYTWHLAALKRCAKIVVIGRDMLKWIKEIYPEDSGKISYIPVWQDEDVIRPMDFKSNPFVVKNQLGDEFVVQYSGNMGLWNEMETIGKVINSKPDKIKFVIIGSGIRRNELLNTIKSGSANVVYFQFQSNADYAQSVAACHVGLVSLRDGLEGIAVPSKIIGIMAAGIPVIALVPAQSEIAYIVREENCGYIIHPSDSEGLLNAIIKLRSDENLRAKFGKNGRDAFLKKYTTRIIARSYESILKG
jgi:glycosyltransferase involved in cell wall biosynthesis